MEMEEFKQKMNKELGALIRYDSEGNAFVSMPVSKIPLNQFKDFDSFVKSEHAGNRWLAIWTLYLRHQQFDLKTEVEYLRQELEHEDSVTETDTNPLGLLGGSR